MRLTCPCCQADFPLEAALNDIAARQAIVRAFRETPFGDLLIGYTNLFKPPRQVIRMTKLARLLEELLDMIGEARVKVGTKVLPAPAAYWQQGIEQMLRNRESLNLPLDSHNYLKKVVFGISDKADARAEQQAEDRKRNGGLPSGQAKSVKSSAPFAVGDILKQINQGGNDGNQA